MKLEPGSLDDYKILFMCPGIRGQVRNNLHCAVMARKLKKAASLKLDT